MTESEIVAGCRRGDAAAQRELYALTCDRIYRLLLRIVRHVEDATDLTQETYLTVFRKIDQYDSQANIYTWMYRIAVNTALQFRRHRQRQEAHHQRQAQQRPPVASDPQLQTDIADALSHLPEPERILIVLKYYEQMNYEEMSRVLNKPAGTIASGLNRARQMLRYILERTELSECEEATGDRHQSL